MAGNILITGGSGAVGTELLNVLKVNSIFPCVLDKLAPSAHSGLEFIESDLVQNDSLSSLEGRQFETIIHLAGLVHEGKSFDNISAYHGANVSATLRMLEFARRSGASHFIMISSTAVCNVDQAFVRTPRSPFIATQMACERFAEVHADLHGLNISVVRVGSMYGSGAKGCLPDLINANQSGEQAILPKLAVEFFPVRVSDVANQLLSELNHGGQGYRILEMGSDQAISDKELVAAVKGVEGELDESHRANHHTCFPDRKPNTDLCVQTKGFSLA